MSKSSHEFNDSYKTSDKIMLFGRRRGTLKWLHAYSLKWNIEFVNPKVDYKIEPHICVLRANN